MKRNRSPYRCLSAARDAGTTLVELIMVMGLGVAMSAAIIQQYLAMTQLRTLQEQLQRSHESAAYARHLLTDVIRRASVVRCTSYSSTGLPAWIQIWRAGDPRATPAVEALQGSSVLSLLEGSCPDPRRSVYFLAHRARNPDNPPALFVRRQRTDGSFAAAEELVEGVSSLSMELVVRRRPEGHDAQYFLLSNEGGFDELSEPVLVNVAMSVLADGSAASAAKSLKFHVSGRQHLAEHLLPVSSSPKAPFLE